MIDATAIHSYLSFACAELHNGHRILQHSDRQTGIEFCTFFIQLWAVTLEKRTYRYETSACTQTDDQRHFKTPPIKKFGGG